MFERRRLLRLIVRAESESFERIKHVLAPGDIALLDVPLNVRGGDVSGHLVVSHLQLRWTGRTLILERRDSQPL